MKCINLIFVCNRVSGDLDPPNDGLKGTRAGLCVRVHVWAPVCLHGMFVTVFLDIARFLWSM